MCSLGDSCPLGTLLFLKAAPMDLISMILYFEAVEARHQCSVVQLYRTQLGVPRREPLVELLYSLLHGGTGTAPTGGLALFKAGPTNGGGR